MNKNKTQPRKPAELAEIVFDAMPELGEAPMSGKMLAQRAGITLAQVYSGIGYLKDNFPDLPLVATSKDGYCWTEDPPKINAFQRWRANSAHTIVRRLWRGTLKPYVDKSTEIGEREREFTTKQFERILEDIGALIGA